MTSMKSHILPLDLDPKVQLTSEAVESKPAERREDYSSIAVGRA
eukprot:SAG31_NODE_26778_length_436_cov_4.729970_1_plen_44_part_00